MIVMAITVQYDHHLNLRINRLSSMASHSDSTAFLGYLVLNKSEKYLLSGLTSVHYLTSSAVQVRYNYYRLSVHPLWLKYHNSTIRVYSNSSVISTKAENHYVYLCILYLCPIIKHLIHYKFIWWSYEFLQLSFWDDLIQAECHHRNLQVLNLSSFVIVTCLMDWNSGLGVVLSELLK